MLFRRIVSIGILLLIIWYIGGKILPYFFSSIGKNASVLLTVKEGGSVQFSLQGQSWQAAVSNVKLYPGDKVMTKSGGDASLTFFDGTRIRLDEGSEISVEESDRQSEGTSTESVTLQSGRLWVSSRERTTFTGSILRVVRTTNFDLDIPASTQALVSATALTVLHADGIGITVTLKTGKNRTISIGEGQMFTLTEQALKALADGEDPYDFREPLSTQAIRDPFVVSSVAYVPQIPSATDSGTTTSNASSEGTTDDLTLTSPPNNLKTQKSTVTVAGHISERVALLLVNGQEVSAAKDGSFSVDVSLGKGPTNIIKVEVQNAQGIPIQRIDRTIEIEEKVITVEPVKIKSPVGSGQTLTTQLTEIDISGEAPAGTDAIMVNDYRLQLFKPGSKTWSYLASTALGNLKEGENVYSVNALDAEGNKSPTRSITIVLTGTTGTGATSVSATSSTPPLRQNAPLTPGVLTVDQPGGTSTETTQNEVVLAGKTSTDTAFISINGYTLSLYEAGKATWNYIASTGLNTMKRGRNIYRIVARNSNGEILDVLEYTIIYRP